MSGFWNEVWRLETKRFSVVLDCEPETDPDLSWDETGEVREKLESGEWDCVCFRVRVLMDGEEIAAEYLGESIYADVRDFAREHIGLAIKSRQDGCNYGAYFPDMVREAIRQARREIARRSAMGFPRVRTVA